MRKLFLSYSPDDAPIVEQVRRDLASCGLTVWTDERLNRDSAAWRTGVENALRASECMVLVMSPCAKTADSVQFEMGIARAENLRIIPVLAWGNERDAVPVDLITAQWVDFRSDYTRAFSQLASALDATLCRDVGANLPRSLNITMGELIYTFDFTAEELELNRKGKASRRQRTRYAWQAAAALMIGLVVVALASWFGYQIIIGRIGTGWISAIKLGICSALGLLALFGIAALGVTYGIVFGETSVTTGEMMREARQPGVTPYIHVGAVGLVVSEKSWENARLAYPGEFRAYYFKRVNRLLSVELREPGDWSGSGIAAKPGFST